MTIQIDIPNGQALAALYKSAPEIVTPILQKYLTASQAILSLVTGQNTPYQTGKLISSFFPFQLTDLSYAWKPTVKYALWVDQGTGIYGPTGARIVPVTARALAWTSGGTTFIRKSIAGMTGRHYMQKIVAGAAPQIVTLFEQAEQSIIAAMSA